MDAQTSKEPIWVKDPLTDSEVNVAPFFEALRLLDYRPEEPMNTGGLSAVRRVLRRLNLTVHDPDLVSFDEMAAIYYDLHLLQEMFERTQNRQ